MIPQLECPGLSLFDTFLFKLPLEDLSQSRIHRWRFEQCCLVREAVTASKVSDKQWSFIDVYDQHIADIVPANAEGDQKIAAFTEWYNNTKLEQSYSVRKFNRCLSDERCTYETTISMSWRLVDACQVTMQMDTIASARYNNRVSRLTPSCWLELIQTQQRRCEEMLPLLERFVFVIPPARQITNLSVKRELEDKVLKGLDPLLKHQLYYQLRNHFDSFYPARVRQEVFFPDRKLVQFDSGKLQALATLLLQLKKGGHKCLIFTQMSRMLDVLEVFLNLHAHTYVRLDGSTGVEKRQRLMDRFNSDPKLFCFILSTRSGGLGINLTGADTVIFYDSDWNPAMDAQAQDRAHRIGQTREVHIYRLVCSSTIEENMLAKARQKQHLDHLVMTEGKFSEQSLLSSRGLQAVLLGASTGACMDFDESGSEMRRADVEAAMAAVEDAEDATALNEVRTELQHETEEFSDNLIERREDDDEVAIEKNDAADGEGTVPGADASSSLADGASAPASDGFGVASGDVAAEEKAVEAEFSAWRASVGGYDFKSLEKALRPVERYAMRQREQIDGFQSLFALTEQQRLQSVALESQELDAQWDVEQIEREKEAEERRALAEGELLAVNLTRKEKAQLQVWFLKERKLIAQQRLLRKMTGAAWGLVIDPVTHIPWWFNEDTGSASYAQPTIVAEREQYQKAQEHGLSAFPIRVLLTVFSYLLPYPDRLAARLVCASWNEAGRDSSLFLRVLPVETGLREAWLKGKAPSLAYGTFADLSQAIIASHRGDTLLLGPGHYWGDTVTVSHSLRIIGQSNDPGRCVLELSDGVEVCTAGLNCPGRGDGEASKFVGGGTVVFAGLSLHRPQRKKVSVHTEEYIRVISSKLSVSFL